MAIIRKNLDKISRMAELTPKKQGRSSAWPRPSDSISEKTKQNPMNYFYDQDSDPETLDPQEPGSEGGNDGNENSDEKREEGQSELYKTGSVTTNGEGGRLHCITIIGQIEGHFLLPSTNKTTKYEHILPLLVAVEEDKTIGGLLIMLNTVGGDVEAGLAIAELIAGMRKPTVSLVLGGGHSIGVPLAVAADCSFIVPSATMTIHPVRMNGPLISTPQTLAYFHKMQERITNFVCTNSHIKPERFNQLLMNNNELVSDVGSILDGESAVKEGIIDHLGGLKEALDELKKMSKNATST